MSSYSLLNITSLRRELRKIDSNISSINKTIAHHKREIEKYNRQIAKYDRRLFPNDVLIRNCENRIRAYEFAIKKLRCDKKPLEEEMEKIKAELKRKQSLRRWSGVVITVVIAGFVLINGQGEMKGEVKKTSIIRDSKEDDSSKSNPEEISYSEDLETVIDEILGFFDEGKFENPEVSVPKR